jgi:anti-sigma B factor antagonist
VTESTKGISVGSAKETVFVRVVGRGTFQNGQPLRRYALERIERGCGEFFVDLTKCDGMDSTFLGVLAGIGLRLRQDGRKGKLHVVNISARNMELLQTLGLDRLFCIGESPSELRNGHPPADTEFDRLPDSDASTLSKPLDKSDTADLMLEAHGNLVRADQRNASRFRDLTKFLREKVEKRKADD